MQLTMYLSVPLIQLYLSMFHAPNYIYPRNTIKLYFLNAHTYLKQYHILVLTLKIFTLLKGVLKKDCPWPHLQTISCITRQFYERRIPGDTQDCFRVCLKVPNYWI